MAAFWSSEVMASLQEGLKISLQWARVRECSSCFWKLWYARCLGGIESEGDEGFGGGKVSGGSATTISIGTELVSRELYVCGK